MNPESTAYVERVRAVFDGVRAEVRKAVVGQEEVLEHVGAALLAGGHILLEGMPGTAKTLMARAFARAIQGRFARIQFTPDLMPADITGSSVFDPEARKFDFHPGPVFTDLLLADEINRAPAKTQSALLEGMQERRVTVDGRTHALSPVFTVIATQNPVEYEGTYPLPEAQLDRFMMKVQMDYPTTSDERTMLARYRDGAALHDVESLGLTPRTEVGELAKLREGLTGIVVEDGVLHYVSDIVRLTRNWATIAVGASPRAAVAYLMACRALAALRGRPYVIPDDVKSAGLAVLRHRVLLKPESEIEGIRADQAVRDVIAAVKVPK
jgi:MoxR-like ATPase